MGRVAELLGKPFMPWQQYVADVALEVNPATGRLAYSEIGLTVPRQSGKSTLLLCKAVHRASAQGFFGPRQRIVYTAQTRQKAREKWEEDYAAELEASRVFKTRVNVHKGNGNEHIRFANGSRFGIEANTEKAGHGGTLDEAYEDEAFALPDARLEQAFRPAMITRKNKQLWWVSTAGWLDASPYLEDKVRLGRERVSAGANTGIAYFEWSAPEDAENYDDPDLWRSCMPALGHTIDLDAIAAEFVGMKLNDFRRAYLNQWVPKEADEEPMIDEVTWGSLTAQDSVKGPISFAVDVTPDRRYACISAAGETESGTAYVEVIDMQQGTDWVVGRLSELVAKWSPCAVVVDKGSPASSLLPDLADADIEVKVPSVQEVGQGCGAFFDAVQQSAERLRDGRAPVLLHPRDVELAAAVVGATTRSIGPDGLWAWDRKNFSVNIAPLVSCTLALWGWSKHHNDNRGGWAIIF